MIDTASNNETHCAGGRSFASTEQWIEDDISEKLEDFRGVSGVQSTIEWNNPQSVREIT